MIRHCFRHTVLLPKLATTLPCYTRWPVQEESDPRRPHGRLMGKAASKRMLQHERKSSARHPLPHLMPSFARWFCVFCCITGDSDVVVFHYHPCWVSVSMKSNIFAFYPGSPLLPILLQLNLAHRSAPAPSSMT